MSTAPTGSSTTGGSSDYGWQGSYDEGVELTTETRRSTSTSEFWIFLVLGVVLLFFAYDSGRDSFSREDGWRFVTYLAIGYFISRGLAKVGSYESYIRGRGRS